MEKDLNSKQESMILAALLKDVKELKDNVDLKTIKEELIIKILSIHDKELLRAVVKAVDNTMFPKGIYLKNPDADAPQGNG